MGWNRLPQSDEPGKSSEQDVHIITWYEILSDAGVPSEHWTACYRAAQQRKNKLMASGVQASIVTPNDLVVEWDGVKRMHAEIDKTRLLPENAAHACMRCFGKRPAADTCDHRPLSKEELDELARERVKEVKQMRADLASKPAVKSMPAEEFKMDLSVTYTCTDCARRVKSDFGWNYHDRCNARLPGPVRDGETLGCRGVMEIR